MKIVNDASVVVVDVDCKVDEGEPVDDGENTSHTSRLVQIKVFSNEFIKKCRHKSCSKITQYCCNL
ncbi:hypothetical protein BpHYR1_005482 [Brachionus plicatilis]|uniref:Uncharacterized protein n=1 Tax=Brachionus plicatilis TaxID=10195 RepID=A0A3M7S2W9_BRAPC|nr:hypothetical protein BpHYR1_005482 [Brachionus plicatilis]